MDIDFSHWGPGFDAYLGAFSSRFPRIPAAAGGPAARERAPGDGDRRAWPGSIRDQRGISFRDRLPAGRQIVDRLIPVIPRTCLPNGEAQPRDETHVTGRHRLICRAKGTDKTVITTLQRVESRQTWTRPGPRKSHHHGRARFCAHPWVRPERARHVYPSHPTRRRPVLHPRPATADDHPPERQRRRNAWPEQ
jgi:hypothetical protein